MPRIALIHAVSVAMRPIHEAFERLWPEAQLTNLLEDSLSPDRAAERQLTPAMTARIEALAHYVAGTGAQGILYTCSAFGPAIEKAAHDLAPLPVLKPNDAMFAEALRAGDRIGMVATFAPACATMEEEFAEAAINIGCTAARLETVLAAGAMTALRAGDEAAHDRLVAEAAGRLAHCDAVMLAHFSTSRALPLAEARLAGAAPVLTAPGAAVRALRVAVDGG